MAFDVKTYDISLTHNQSGSNVQQDFVIATEPETGNLLYKQMLLPEISAQQRTDAFSYEHRNPLIDLPAAFEDWSLGAGFEDAVANDSLGYRGYNYTRNVDLSWRTRGYLGPEKQTGGSTVQAPLKFVRSSLGLFAMTSRYVYENVSGTWTERFDNGGTITNNDLIEFTNSAGTYLLLGVSSQSYYISSDGTSWTQPSSNGAAPSFRSASTAGQTSASSVSPTEPAGAAEDDIILAAVVTDVAEAITPPAGWSTIHASVKGSTSYGFYWIRRTGSAPSYAFSWTTATRCRATAAAYSGVNPNTSPFDNTLGGAGDDPGSITSDGANRMAVVLIGATADDGGATSISFTPASGYTERADASAGPGAMVADKGVSEGAEDPGDFTSTGGTSEYAVVILVPDVTGARDISRWAVRGSSSGAPLVWGIDSEGDIRNASDPTEKTNWSAVDTIQIGESSVTISGLEVIDNEFFLVHDGGITSYDGTTVSTVWSAGTLKLASNQARTAIGPDNLLYFSYDGTLLRMDTATLGIEKVWPRGPQIGNSELNGTITAITFDQQNGYFATKNAAGNTYLMKFDPFFQVTIGDYDIWPVHTYYYNGASDCGALLVVDASSDNFSSTNQTVMMGDGTTADYLILPRPGLRPEDDSNCRFDTGTDNPVYGAFINYRSQSFPKWLTRGDIEVDDADANDTIAIQYQTVGGTATTIATANSDGRTTATLSSEVSFTKIRPVFLFNNGANTTTPILLGGVLHAAPNAPRDRAWVMTVKIANANRARNGLVVSSQDARNQSEFLFNARNEFVSFVDILGVSHNVKVLDIDQVATSYGIDNQIEEMVQIALVELTS